MDAAIMRRTPDKRRALVAKRIKRARELKGLSQAALARQAGYTRAAVSLMERTGGMSEVGRRVIAGILEIDPAILR